LLLYIDSLGIRWWNFVIINFRLNEKWCETVISLNYILVQTVARAFFIFYSSNLFSYRVPRVVCFINTIKWNSFRFNFQSTLLLFQAFTKSCDIFFDVSFWFFFWILVVDDFFFLTYGTVYAEQAFDASFFFLYLVLLTRVKWS
jgi:hypothetical protein